MYVARVPNRGSPPAILLRESYREGGKVKNRTLANLSRWPEHKVDALSRALKGLPPARDLSEAFEITRSLPHGHVAAVLGTAQRLGLPELIDATPSRNRDLVSAMLIAQVIGPGSKLATARGLRTETATSSLGQVLGVSGCDEDDLYAAMDWALARKEAIENTLAARHLSEGTLVLYDVSSAAFEGRTCPLGAIGHPRDGVKGRLQIVYGLLCTTAGIPIAIEVFEGNTADPNTLAAQISKLKNRFGLSRVCLVGDRGMLTNARIRDEVRPAQLDWVSALRAPQIKALVEEGALQLSLFDEQDLFEICSRSFPGERLVCCHNPVLAQQRARKRQELLAATEKELTPIAAATRRERRPLRGKDTIALRVGKLINHYKMAKRFTIEIAEDSFTFTRNTEAIAAEAALDGIYVLPHQPARTDPGHRRCGVALQGIRRRRTILPHPQQRARRPPHPASAGQPGPRPHVLADACLLPGLAHETSTWPQSCSSTTTNPPLPPNAPTPWPQLNAPMTRWPKPPVNAPPRTPRCTASPACSPT